MYQAFVLLAVFLGTWFGIEKIYPEFKFVAGTLCAVAFAAQMFCWKLADSLTSGEGFE